MARAVLKNGVLVPIDPLPREWADGRELWVEDSRELQESSQALDEWAQKIEASAAEIDDQDWQEMQAFLDKMHKEVKEQTRQRMIGNANSFEKQP